MFYYAKVSENQICTSIETRTKELPRDLDGFIKIADYNENLLWRKWLGNQWSQETYEPSIDTVLQDRIKQLEEDLQLSNKENERLKNKVTELEGTILELTSIISSLQGGN